MRFHLKTKKIVIVMYINSEQLKLYSYSDIYGNKCIDTLLFKNKFTCRFVTCNVLYLEKVDGDDFILLTWFANSDKNRQEMDGGW